MKKWYPILIDHLDSEISLLILLRSDFLSVAKDGKRSVIQEQASSLEEELWGEGSGRETKVS